MRDLQAFAIVAAILATANDEPYSSFMGLFAVVAVILDSRLRRRD